MRARGEKWLIWGAAAGAVVALNACVVGIESRPSRQQVMQGPPPPPPERASAMGLISASTLGMPPSTATPPEDRVQSKADQLPVSGYYHWDGVRYVWTEESVEARRLPFRWSP